ncbi:MAG: hypothetical protein D6778_08325 [Nitrospirae bacterium]|nr:MAG: hypothetical protein D6778_08325 [Nitrospirota bacterium]
MKKAGVVIALIGFSLGIFSCNKLPSASEKVPLRREQTVEVAARVPQSGLACFKCHSGRKFQETFPHETHRSMGLHCSQCHSMRAHNSASISVATCNNCHNFKELLLKTSEMPVRFNHALHIDMFSCRECHGESLPIGKKGIKITMQMIQQGRYCGKCHNGKLAFSSNDCGGCHK